MTTNNPHENGEAGGHTPAGRVDVEVDVLALVLELQEQQLRHDHVGHGVRNRRADEDDPFAKEPTENVVLALTTAGLFDHHWDHRHDSSPL